MLVVFKLDKTICWRRCSSFAFFISSCRSFALCVLSSRELWMSFAGEGSEGGRTSAA